MVTCDFTAIDADTKLIVTWHVGSRDIENATIFMQDLAAGCLIVSSLPQMGIKCT
jgi:hypothetical protein